MLDKLADSITAELVKQNNNKEPSVVEWKITMYEDAIALRNTSFPMMTGDEKFQKSFKKLLDMYKSGALDGSRTTYVCVGKVIEIATPEEMPPYTIVDEPERRQNHFRTAFGPRSQDGFHFVKMELSLQGYPLYCIHRDVMYDTGSNTQSIDLGGLLAITNINAYPPGTILPT